METVSQEKKLKILYVITKSNYGGAQRYLYDLATHVAREHEVAVALGGTGAKNAGTGLLKEKLEEQGIRTITIKNFTRDMFLIKDIAAFFELLSVIRVERPDVLHTTSSKAGGLGVLAGRICGVKKIIFTSHGLAYDEDRSPFARVLIFVSTWCTILLSHKTIVITKDSESRTRSLPLLKNKIIYIPNGIAPISFDEKFAARGHLEQMVSTKISSDTLWIGTIAELTPNKNLVTGLSAITEVRNTYPNIVWFIIGDGEEKEMLHKDIKTHGLEHTIFLTGYVRDAARLMKAFDIFFLPSKKEGLPYVLLEASHAGVPSLVSEVGGNPDIVEDGKNGFVAGSNDVSIFAEKINLLGKDKEMRTRFGSDASMHAGSLFSKDRMADETLALYEAVLS